MDIVITIVFGILVVYIVYFFLKEKQYSKESTLGNIASTIGVLGTFVGISIGLWDFDPNDIASSVPLLLSGMKMDEQAQDILRAELRTSLKNLDS